MLVTDPKFHEKSRQRPQALGTGYELKHQLAIELKKSTAVRMAELIRSNDIE
jgi:hypothetical protein